MTIFGDGLQTRDFVYVKDVARAIIHTMTTNRISAGFHVFNVCTGTETTINKLARITAELFGYKSEEIVRYRPEREGDIKQSVCDPTKMNMELGYTAQVQIQDGLRSTKQWFTDSKQNVVNQKEL
jgi:UDP-glucose 4-epimerase